MPPLYMIKMLSKNLVWKTRIALLLMQQIDRNYVTVSLLELGIESIKTLKDVIEFHFPFLHFIDELWINQHQIIRLKFTHCSFWNFLYL